MLNVTATCVNTRFLCAGPLPNFLLQPLPKVLLQPLPEPYAISQNSRPYADPMPTYADPMPEPYAISQNSQTYAENFLKSFADIFCTECSGKGLAKRRAKTRTAIFIYIYRYIHLYIYIYIYIYIISLSLSPPPCPKHDMACFFTERSESHDYNIQVIIQRSLTIPNAQDSFWVRPTYLPTTPSCLWNHFFGLQLRPRNLTLYKPPGLKSTQNRPKSFPNPQNGSKTTCHLAIPKILKKCTPPIRKFHFLTFPSPQKSFQNRCQNAFKIGFILDTLLESQKYDF